MEDNHMNYAGLELFLTKSKGKKKRRGRKNKAPSSSGDTRSDAETTDNVNQSDAKSGIDDAKEGSKDIFIPCRNGDDVVYEIENRISQDGFMKVPPETNLEKNLQDEENELETSMNKMIIEEKALETVNNNIEINRPFSLIKTRVLSKGATTYELENFDKNALIIFNHKDIIGQQPRYGTEKDVSALTTTFANFGFEVTTHNDLTKDGLFNELKKFSEKDFTDYGCVAVAILTHGSNNGMLRAKDQFYSEIEVINHFKDYSKPTLVTKPKIFIIQACRGTKIMTGVPVFNSGKVCKDLGEEDLEPYILPVESDLLILHSSYPGRASHRDIDHGTWFIQTLCKKIDALYSTQDLESIITEVKRDVAIDKQHEEYNRRTFEMNVNKQMPVMTSTLIRKLYLKKFGEKHVEQTYVQRSRSQSEGSQDVVDDASNVPPSPLLVQFGPCACFLDHFTYMRNCLKHFVEENPNDETAQDFLDAANTFEDTVQFNSSKDKMCKIISKHLMEKARTSQFYKYLYFYNYSS